MNTFHESKTPSQDEINEMNILYYNLKNILLFQLLENNFDTNYIIIHVFNKPALKTVNKYDFIRKKHTNYFSRGFN